MTAFPQNPDLERIAARQLAAYLEEAAIGTSLPIDSTSALCDTLELFIPQVMRQTHSEWEKESIDGFSFSHALKGDDASAELAGTCILISDQSVTPFKLDLHLAPGDMLRPLRIRLGERGGGALAISGPAYNTRAARDLLVGLDARLNRIEWVYDVCVT